MNRVRVKICGVTNPEDRDVVVGAGADAVGFISDVPVETPREVSPERAGDLARGLPPFVTSVLVTMPTSVQDAVALQEQVRADAVQLHGGLEPSYVGGLAERVDADVVVAVDNDDDRLDEYAGAADMLLVDSTTDEGAGGTGETHDWERTRAIAAGVDVPVGLAGGLTPDNVGEAVETVEPYAVDTASGVEQDGGRKDHDAVRSFVANARGVAG